MKVKTLVLFLVAVLMPLALSGQKTGKKANKITITVIVKDAEQKPVEDAVLLIDKKKTSTVSDEKGSYKIKIRAGAEMVTALSFNKNGIGESKIGGQDTINIKLSELTRSQKEEYSYLEQKSNQRDVNKVNTEDDKYAGYSNIYEMLRGAVPGVIVTGTSVNVRGASSFNSSTEPLFIVDGQIVSSLSGIHPSEVKSIEVLKGSSTVIYGAQGSCGVIKITTKGSTGK